MKTRSDIDGIRALAVLAVLFFHAGVPGFSGGFVGVDVFFVISGYLITKILHDEMVAGRFSLGDFYLRRLRRLGPVLAVVIAVCMIAALLLLMPQDLERYSASAAASAFFMGNNYFAGQTGYFAAPAELEPLLHLWSLGVEGQFYLVFPVLLYGLFRAGRSHVMAGVAFLLIASFAASVWAIETDNKDAFFLTQYRAWELLLGSCLALGFFPRAKMRAVLEAEAIVGVFLMAVAVLTYSHSTEFPGVAALLPCASALLLIHAGADTFVARALSIRPLVFVGQLSYSLYLWHWPVFTFFRHAIGIKPEGFDTVSLLLISLTLAYLSWRFVEQPVRRRQVLVEPKSLVAATGAMMAACYAFGVLAVSTNGLPNRLTPDQQRYVAMYDKTKYRVLFDRGGCFLDKSQQSSDYDLERCLGPKDHNRKDEVLLFGDSFAANLYPGLLANGTNVGQYSAASCRPMELNNRCSEIYEAFFSRILPATTADTIILAAFWTKYFDIFGRREFERRLAETIERIRTAGKRVIVFGQTPTFQIPVPYLVARFRTAEVVRIASNDIDPVNESLRALSELHGVTFVNPADSSCNDDGCIVAEHGRPFHWDLGHMTLEGSEFYARTLLASTDPHSKNGLPSEGL